MALYAASAVHSALLVGLLRAKMIGLSEKLAMLERISSVKAPPCAAALESTEKLLSEPSVIQYTKLGGKIV